MPRYLFCSTWLIFFTLYSSINKDFCYKILIKLGLTLTLSSLKPFLILFSIHWFLLANSNNMKLFHLLSILLAIAAVTNTQIIGLIAIIEIAIQIIEAEEVIATLSGEAEFVLTAVQTEEDSILISSRLESGWATLFEGTSAEEIANYQIEGMYGGISDDIAMGETSPVSTMITWNQFLPIANEEWTISFGTEWTGNAVVGTDGSFILEDTGLSEFDAVVNGAGAEGIETNIYWDMDLLTQYDEAEFGGGNTP